LIDLILKNGNVVFPNRFVRKTDIGITDGKITHLGRVDEEAKDKLDVSGKYVFPGAIDSHFHVGIYRPIPEDAQSESSSAVSGGVTTILSYFRTGRYYMDSSEPYLSLFPRVLKQSEGNFYSDYGYHLAPMRQVHIAEIPSLVKDYGVTTFKFYMFLRGSEKREEAVSGRSEKKTYLLSDDPYDLGHLYSIMKEIAKLRNQVNSLRLSIHAEDPEIIRIHSDTVRSSSHNKPALEQLNNSRPAESERFAILQAAYLSLHTNCPINILHLSSALGLKTIEDLRSTDPLLDIIVETAPHYLVLDDRNKWNTLAKIYPPIRSANDSRALWNGIIHNQIDTIGSDHCCSKVEFKDTDIWSARPGFGSSELLFPALITYGHLKRRIGLERIAELLSKNPATYFGLQGAKGDIEIGYDADLAICDLSEQRVVNHNNLHSAQDFSPFDGLNLCGWITTTILRGRIIYEDKKVKSGPVGKYLNRTNLRGAS
jgi:dihydroorotase (multifunctional complex type)